MLNLSIKKNAAVSIHRQLVTQLSLQIAAGLIPEGTRLPSVRGLSQRLSIHYNTCLSVYQELVGNRMIESRRGSGYIVSRFQPDETPEKLQDIELQQLANYFVKAVIDKGYEWSDVEIAFSLARTNLSKQKSVVFADVTSDILPVFRAELEAGLQVSIQTLDLSENAKPLVLNAQALIIVSRFHYKTLTDKVPEAENVLVIDISTTQDAAKEIEKLPEGSLITLISCSATILQMAESIISGLRGEELLVRAVLLSEGASEIQQACKHAKLVLCDLFCFTSIEPLIRQAPFLIKLIPDSEIEKIKLKTN